MYPRTGGQSKVLLVVNSGDRISRAANHDLRTVDPVNIKVVSAGPGDHGRVCVGTSAAAAHRIGDIKRWLRCRDPGGENRNCASDRVGIAICATASGADG